MPLTPACQELAQPRVTLRARLSTQAPCTLDASCEKRCYKTSHQSRSLTAEPCQGKTVCTSQMAGTPLVPGARAHVRCASNAPAAHHRPSPHTRFLPNAPPCSLPEAKLSLYRQAVHALVAQVQPVQPPAYCRKPAAKAALPATLSAGALAAAARCMRGGLSQEMRACSVWGVRG